VLGVFQLASSQFVQPASFRAKRTVFGIEKGEWKRPGEETLDTPNTMCKALVVELES
jgi:hypothetical protein